MSWSKTFTRGDVAQHSSKEDCWVIFDNVVYDVTDFIADHPGGEELIMEYAGQDVTAIMKNKDSHVHSRSAYTMLGDFAIGKVSLPETMSPEGMAPAFLPADAHISDDFVPEETDVAKDYVHHQFLDLSKPLIPQMWYSSFSKEFYLEQVHIPRHCKEPAQLMPYAFLEVFTKTPWYVIPMMWLPIAAAFFHLSATQYKEFFYTGNATLSNMEGYAAAFGCFVFGVVFWTFIEYLFHRFLFHMDRLLPRHQFFYLMHFLLHGIHHFLPMDRYRLVMPPVLFATLSFPMLLLAHAVLPTAMANGVISGSYSMYVVYDTMHYALHHTKLPEYVREQKRYHLEHHYKNYELGFGVTSKIWDYVFHTVLV